MGAGVRRWLPGLAVVSRYERGWIRDDIVAGIVLTAVLIPAGIGYAQVAGLPPVTGLYATIVPLMVYAVVGPSRILVLGPDSALAPIIGAAVLPLALGDTDRAVALAGLLAILVGLFLIVGSVFRLGFVTDLLSKPIRIGFLNGVALVVMVGQLPALFGFSVSADSFFGDLRGLVDGIGDGDVDARAVSFGLGSIVVIQALRVARSRVPGVLVAVVVSMVLVAALGWRDDIAVVGSLPRGLPAPSLGGLEWGDVLSLLGPALGIALISFAETGVLSRAFAARRGQRIDGSDEMRGLGAANLATGVLGGFAVSSSMTRTPVAEQAGARTQLTGVTGALLVVGFVLLIPDVTSVLPSATLAAVIIVAAANLIDLPEVVRLVRVEPIDGLLSIAAGLGVVLIGVLEGIVITIALSVVAFTNNAWRPYRAELGRIPRVRGYHALGRHPDASRVDAIAIGRFDAPLFFASSGICGDYVRSIADSEPRPKHLVLAAEPITSIDSTAIDELIAVDDYLAQAGVDLVFAELKDPVRDRLIRHGLAERFGPERFAPTVGAAVDTILGHERDDIGNPSDRT